MTALNATVGLHSDAGFSFGGAGFLIFYYFGIVETLTKLGVVGPATKFAGSSSGAIISTGHCAGVETDKIYKASLGLAHACRNEMSCSGTLDRHIRQVIQSTIPADAYKRCKDKGFIAITTGRVLLNDHHPMLISDFKDNAELVAAAACSSFIPLWSGGSMTTHFRGLPVYDGGFASHQPCPPGVKLCVRISTSNPAWARRSSVETFMARLAMKGPAALAQPDPTIKSYPPITPTGSDGPDPELLKLAAAKGVDIAPGIYNKMPFTQQEWNEYALAPGDDGTLDFMFQLGTADAAAWAKHAGMATKTQAHSSGGGRTLTAGQGASTA